MVAFYASPLCAVALGWNLGIIGMFNRSFSEFFLAPLLCMFLCAFTSYRKAFDGAESVARLGLLLSDTAVSQRNALKELVSVGEARSPAA